VYRYWKRKGRAERGRENENKCNVSFYPLLVDKVKSVKISARVLFSSITELT
jgi:hypothetical protein